MINMERELNIIDVLADRIEQNLDIHYESEDIVRFLKDWKLSSLAESYVGPTGRLEIKLEPSRELANSLSDDIRTLINRAASDFRSYKYDYSVIAASLERFSNNEDYKSIKEVLSDEVKVRIYEAASSYFNHFDFKVVGNLVRLEIEDFPVLKSAHKTFSSLDHKARKLLEELQNFYGTDINDFKDQVENLDKSRDKVFSGINDLSQAASSSLKIGSGKLVLSALPSDILTASVNNNKFRSCFAPDGEYSLSPVGYAHNENVIIAYFSFDGETIRLGDEVVDDKSWRLFLFIDENGYMQSSQYPNRNNYLIKLVTDTVAKIKPDFKKGSGQAIYSTSFYCDGSRDWYHVNPVIDVFEITNVENSPTDGTEINSNYNTLFSYNELAMVECFNCCEEFTDVSDLIEVSNADDMSNKEHYCEFCVEDSNYIFYSDCSETHIYDSNYVLYLDSFGNIEKESLETGDFNPKYKATGTDEYDDPIYLNNLDNIEEVMAVLGNTITIEGV